MSVALLLSRLDAPRPSGKDRWRCACPVCGEGNCSTLSVGIGESGAVLLKCFKSGCEPDGIANALGLQMTDLFPDRPSAPGGGNGPQRRRRLLADRQALELLDNETLLVWTAAQNLANGHALTPTDLSRLNVAAQRLNELLSEAHQ